MESEFVRYLRDRLPDHPCLRLGPGDDGALLSLANRGENGPSDIVVTTDLLTEGVDFRLDEVDPRRIGHKALAVNLSDLAAMAAEPLAVVIAVALPRKDRDSQAVLDLAVALFEGMLPLAERSNLAIAGGDTNTWDGPLVISVTALGTVTEHGPLTRSGGLTGDAILVTGQLGGSILGRHLDVEPRVEEAMLLQEKYELHAGIDISDGLTLDLSRLASESRCGAVLDIDLVPIAPAARELAQKENAPDIGATALRHALGDGEDFELLLAVPPEEAQKIVADQPLACPVTKIGELIADEGLWQRKANEKIEPLKPTGWLH